MKVATYEGTVVDGQIKLDEAVRLPEHARVYVIVPGVKEVTRIHGDSGSFWYTAGGTDGHVLSATGRTRPVPSAQTRHWSGTTSGTQK